VKLRAVREWGRAEWFVVLGIVLAAGTFAAVIGDNALAGGVLQALAIGFSAWGSYLYAQLSAAAADRDLIRARAKPAFRRMRTLAQGLARQQQAIADEMERLEGLSDVSSRSIELELVRSAMIRLEAMVIEQVVSSTDALEDWRDLAPEQVAEIEAAATAEREDHE
jgi:hypothetical protein